MHIWCRHIRYMTRSEQTLNVSGCNFEMLNVYAGTRWLSFWVALTSPWSCPFFFLSRISFSHTLCPVTKKSSKIAEKVHLREGINNDFILLLFQKIGVNPNWTQHWCKKTVLPFGDTVWPGIWIKRVLFVTATNSKRTPLQTQQEGGARHFQRAPMDSHRTSP